MARRPSTDRYSRIIAALKIGLPLGALALLASVFLLSGRDDITGGLEFSAADLERMGTGLRVTNPRFSGASVDGDLYDFAASAVTPQDLTMRVAAIEDLSGTVRFIDGRQLSLEAPVARIDMDARILTMEDGIALHTSDGYNARSAAVSMDLRQGSLTGSGGVRADGPLGEIEADGLIIGPAGPDAPARLSKESVITFTGHVRLRYVPPQASQEEGNDP